MPLLSLPLGVQFNRQHFQNTLNQWNNQGNDGLAKLRYPNSEYHTVELHKGRETLAHHALEPRVAEFLRYCWITVKGNPRSFDDRSSFQPNVQWHGSIKHSPSFIPRRCYPHTSTSDDVGEQLESPMVTSINSREGEAGRNLDNGSPTVVQDQVIYLDTSESDDDRSNSDYIVVPTDSDDSSHIVIQEDSLSDTGIDSARNVNLKIIKCDY